MYCGTCKSDICYVDKGICCCHDEVRYGYCNQGHRPQKMAESRDGEARNMLNDATEAILKEYRTEIEVAKRQLPRTRQERTARL